MAVGRACPVQACLSRGVHPGASCSGPGLPALQMNRAVLPEAGGVRRWGIFKNVYVGRSSVDSR